MPRPVLRLLHTLEEGIFFDGRADSRIHLLLLVEYESYRGTAAPFEGLQCETQFFLVDQVGKMVKQKMAQICDRPQTQNLCGIRPNPFPPYEPICLTEIILRPKNVYSNVI